LIDESYLSAHKINKYDAVLKYFMYTLSTCKVPIIVAFGHFLLQVYKTLRFVLRNRDYKFVFN